MTTPRLSISIPTYNFGKFIGEMLDSILPQVTDEVEVLVVDGASTDDTEGVARKRQERFPLLKYYRLPKKGGIDRDMAKAVTPEITIRIRPLSCKIAAGHGNR